MKIIGSKTRKSVSGNSNLSVLYSLNPHLLVTALVYYLLASKLPSGQPTGNGLIALILILFVYAFSVLNDLFRPKGLPDVFSKKVLFKQNQVFLTRSIVGTFVGAAIILFVYHKDLWLFAGIMVASTGAYIYLFNFTFPDNSYSTMRSFCASLLLMTACFGLSWMSDEIGRESKFAFCLSFLVIWQNGLLKKEYAAISKKGSNNLASKIIGTISLLIIVVAISGCYLSEYRFSQRFFTILMMTGIAQGTCLWQKETFSRNQYIQTILRILPILPIAIL